MISERDSLEDIFSCYKNTEEINDIVHNNFTELTNTIAFLGKHRDYIKKYRLGFGDRAFHYMWYLLLTHLTNKIRTPHLLEIGVYKGQVISLWSLITKNLNAQSRITAITPLQGNCSYSSRLILKLHSIFSPRFKEEYQVGNIYAKGDYLTDIKKYLKCFI
jgi:hypothetical protein